jgi:hypothetical protein
MAWEVKRHEGYWLGQQWVRSRFGDQLIVEFATIKCLMFRPYTRKEIFQRRNIGRPSRSAGVWHRAMSDDGELVFRL